MATAVVGVLLVGVAVLAFFAAETDTRWAWTINPKETSYFIAAGYFGGIYFFGRVLTERRWHRVSLGFPAITIFVWSMLAATVLHWDRFHVGKPAMIAWTATYVATSVIVPALWLLHRGRDKGGAEPDDALVPPPIRIAAGAVGATLVLVGLSLFVDPGLARGAWPWDLTDLTGRVLGGWYLLPGILMVECSLEPRWSSWRIPVESQIFSIAAILLAAFVSRSDLHPSRPATLLYIVAVVGLLAALLSVHTTMEHQHKQHKHASQMPKTPTA